MEARKAIWAATMSGASFYYSFSAYLEACLPLYDLPMFSAYRFVLC